MLLNERNINTRVIKEGDRFGFKIDTTIDVYNRSANCEGWVETKLTVMETCERIGYQLGTVWNLEKLRESQIYNIKNDISSSIVNMNLEQKSYQIDCHTIVFNALTMHLESTPGDATALVEDIEESLLDVIYELVDSSLVYTEAQLKAIRWTDNLDSVDDIGGLGHCKDSQSTIAQLAYWSKCADVVTKLSGWGVLGIRASQILMTHLS